MQSIVDAKVPHTVEILADSTPLAHALPGRRVEIRKRRLVNPTLVLSDAALALLVFWIAAITLQMVWGGGAPLSEEVVIAAVVSNAVVWVGLRGLLGLYPGYGLDPSEELRRQTLAGLAALVLTTIFAVAFHAGDLLSYLLLVSSFLGLLVLAPLGRHLVKRTMEKAGAWGKPVVILSSSGETGERLSDTLLEEWGLGLKPVAVFQNPLATGLAEGDLHNVVLDDAEHLAGKRRVDTIILDVPDARLGQLTALSDWASLSFRHVIFLPAGLVGGTAAVTRSFAGTSGVEIKHNLLDPWTRGIKRGLDLFGAVAGGLLISPLLLALVVLVKLDSPGPAFYGHQRLGVGDRLFRCWKLRTMHPDAERLLDEYLQDNPTLRAEWEQNQKLRDDPRVTRIGRFLRKTSLDELPQLWNVLRGEMSLVGPRPIVDAEVAKYEETYGLYTRTRPGMSGFWQVGGRSDTSYSRRVAMDAYYVRNWSVWLDLLILARTISIVIGARGAR